MASCWEGITIDQISILNSSNIRCNKFLIKALKVKHQISNYCYKNHTDRQIYLQYTRNHSYRFTHKLLVVMIVFYYRYLMLKRHLYTFCYRPILNILLPINKYRSKLRILIIHGRCQQINLNMVQARTWFGTGSKDGGCGSYIFRPYDWTIYL